MLYIHRYQGLVEDAHKCKERVYPYKNGFITSTELLERSRYGRTTTKKLIQQFGKSAEYVIDGK